MAGKRESTTEERQPTLADVAGRAGVSTATVSRCLNSPDQVLGETRARVMQAIQEMGYLPNFGARALAARRTRTIGAIIPTMENAIFARGIQAFQEELHGLGYTLLAASSSYNLDREEEQIRALAARGADGLLLIGQDRRPSALDFLLRNKIPALAVWTCATGGALPSVGFDNRAAMRGLAQKVISLGHRRLALISAATSENDRARERLKGVREAVETAGAGEVSLHVIETSYRIELGAEAFVRLMDQPDRPTAVMCGNDVLAAGALLAARRMGIDVPRQVSVTGFDDIDLAQVVQPALTTVHVPHREMGRQAARCLIDMVESGAPVRSIGLRTEIRHRDSLAPAPTES